MGDSWARGSNSDSVDLGSNPGSPARESASNRCVFVVSSLAGIVLKLPRVSYPANPSATTRDAKCLGAGRERPQGLSRPFRVVGCGAFRLDFDGGLGGEAEETALFLPVMRQVFAQSQQPARRQRVGLTAREERLVGGGRGGAEPVGGPDRRF